MLKRHILLALTALTTAGAANAQTTVITYTGSFNAGAGSANYTFTTDGTLGAINERNLLSYSISLQDSSGTVVLTQANSSKFNFAMTATAENLNVRRNGTSGGVYIASYALTGGVFDGALNINFLNGTFLQILSNSYRGVLTGDFATNLAFVPPVINPSVSAVPEPASWAMMIGGFGLVGGAARRRRAQRTTVRFA